MLLDGGRGAKEDYMLVENNFQISCKEKNKLLRSC